MASIIGQCAAGPLTALPVADGSEVIVMALRRCSVAGGGGSLGESVRLGGAHAGRIAP